ncbi:MAG: hypothetical protein K6B51_06015 [Bacilli bacterium]|nr:hypothetical protein [Bacilli bacterium]
MKSKKSLTFLAGIALLSLSACESLGSKITIEEARNIQQAITEDGEKDPTKVYTTDMSIKGNMEKTIDGTKSTANTAAHYTVACDFNRGYTKITYRANETQTANNGFTKEENKAELSATFFYQDGEMYACMAYAMNGTSSKTYSHSKITLENACSGLMGSFPAPLNIGYASAMSANCASQMGFDINNLFDDFKFDESYYSKGSGNLSAVVDGSSDELNGGNGSGKCTMSTTATADNRLLTKSTASIKADYKNGDDKGNLDLSLTLNSKRDCSINRPNLKEYAETNETNQDAMTALLLLVLATYSNYQA